MRIIFIRHAQAAHNADALIRGDIAYHDPIHKDSSITELGKQQIAKGEPYTDSPDVIYCSPMRRCRQTLLTMYPAFSESIVHLDDRLMETQGIAMCNRRSSRPDILGIIPPQWNTTGIDVVNPFDLIKERYSLEESDMTEFADRIRAFTTYLLAKHRDETVLIMAHHDWIRTWYYIYKNVRISPKNCEVLRTEIDAL
jgi:broad specificity phosphatase PhoE